MCVQLLAILVSVNWKDVSDITASFNSNKNFSCIGKSGVFCNSGGRAFFVNAVGFISQFSNVYSCSLLSKFYFSFVSLSTDITQWHFAMVMLNFHVRFFFLAVCAFTNRN